ncbi:MAG: endolytic transglycosylase MltG [Spirochaetota bacterium]
MLRTAVRIITLVVLALFLLGSALAAVAYYLNQPPQEQGGSAVSFRIESGESLGRIAARLEKAGVIREDLLLRGISRLRGTQTAFQTGSYRLEPGQTTVRVHDYLTSGGQVLHKVTVPEGWTATDIAARLESRGITPADEFEKAIESRELLDAFSIEAESAEGFLYPDTYLFNQDYPAEKVARHMLSTFFGVLREIEPDIEEMDSQELFERVIVASIVEREYLTKEEAPKIASVFYNRLDGGYRLESCATVAYVMTEEQGLDHPEKLFYRDLERESPYNTYRNSGLPPGPISNPGKVALDAAFHPADTDYYYFVLEGPEADEHHFSKSLEEHNEAKVLYLKNP